AVLDVAKALEVAAGKRGGVSQHGNGNRAQRSSSGGVSVPDELRGSRGDKSDRRNRANIISADIVFAAHVEAAIGRNFFAAKSRDVRQLRVQTQHVASLVDRFEAFEFEYVGDRVDVSADRTASECQRIEIAFTFQRLMRIVDVVVLHSRRDRTG